MKREEEERKERVAREKREAEEKRVNELVRLIIYIKKKNCLHYRL